MYVCTMYIVQILSELCNTDPLYFLVNYTEIEE